jgi:microcystin degradation protein MlrC
VEYAIKNAPSGCPTQWKLPDAIADLVERREFPALLVEPADNIGGGAPGDATWILEALVQSGTELKSGIIINDPDAAAKLHALNVGESTTVPLGGDFPSLSGPCIEVPLKLLKKIDGKFTVEDLHSHIVSMCGSQIEMGPTALASYGNILILVTTHKTPPMDLGQWRCVGVDPADFEIIGIKAAVAHRQAYDRISRRSYTVSTPGCCTSDLKTLSYHNVERPAFPLEGK